MKKRLLVTVGIAAYNEEQNIARLITSILEQKLKRVFIKEILVISSGSSDKTNSITNKLAKKNKRVKLIRQTKRLGKASAVNIILSKSKQEIIVLCSADILLKSTTLEKLVSPLSDPGKGIVGSHPIPLNDKNTFFGYTAHLLWRLHHEISLRDPKMGECIAFRKVFTRLSDKSSVDEANIESLIKPQGFQSVYAQQAIVYNLGAQNLHDFVNRRRHIYAGHLQTMSEFGYRVSTIRIWPILSVLRTQFHLSWRFIFWTPIIVLLEAYSRILGFIDYKYKRNSHTIWKVTASTKKLPLPTHTSTRRKLALSKI